jgi:hypothetical protein
MSFSFPSEWRAQYAGYGSISMESNLIVYLGTERLHTPCRVIHGAGGAVSSSLCGLSLNPLPRNGVLVSWTRNGFLGFRLASVPGTRTRIGGLPARIVVHTRSVRAPNPCVFVGATGSVTAYISTAPDNWVEMDACKRGANFARFEAQVRAMLRSVSFRA